MKITSDEASTALSIDEIFDLLVSRRRRAVLYELYGRSEPVAISDLATAVCKAEGTENAAARTGEQTTAPREITISLNHIHLPKLQQAGVVEYDRVEGTVRLKWIPRQFERYLRFAAEDDERSLST